MLPVRHSDESQIGKFAREHLAWEMGRFRRGVALWGRRDGEEGAMLRESCLIHLRLLLDFLYPRGTSKRYPDDVRPEHFVADGHWDPPEPPWLQGYRDRLDQLLVHLTYKRLDWAEDQRMVWRPEQQFAHVEQMWGQFLSSLPEDRRRWFSEPR